MFLHRGMIEAAKTRRRGRRRDGARDRARGAAARHRAGDQGRRSFRSARSPVRSSARSSAARPAASSRRARRFGLGAYFLKYGREYERQADLLGAQIMARAGYDPRRMADMFRTIEQQGGGRGGPEWLSSHPNPGQSLRRDSARKRRCCGSRASRRRTREFSDVKARLARHVAGLHRRADRARQGERPPPARQRAAAATTISPARTRGNVRVEPPSTRYQARARRQFPAAAACPTTGEQIERQQQRHVRAGGRRTISAQQRQTGFTHGLQVGRDSERIAQPSGRRTEELIESLQQGNPQMRRQSNGYVRETIGGRTGLSTTLRNVSEVDRRAPRS